MGLQKRSRAKRRIILSVAVFTALDAFAPRLHAATLTDVWLGGGDNSWTTPSHWSLNLVPKNDATNQFDVKIDQNASKVSGAWYNTAATINSLVVDADDGIRMENSGSPSLTVSGEISLNGTIASSAGNLTLGSGLLNGSGLFQVFGGSGRIRSTAGSLTIGSGMDLNAKGDTFSPHVFVGESTYPLINNGTIEALSPFTTATISGSTVTNNGTLFATDGATLEVNTTIQQLSDLGMMNFTGTGKLRLLGTINNTGRTLILDGAFPLQIGGTITGGTIAASGTAQLVIAGSSSTVLDNVILNAPTKIQNSVFLPSNQGLIGSADITLSATLAGQGGTFTIGSGFNIHGSGTVGNTSLPLVNDGNITAAVSGSTLTVTGNSIVNHGSMSVSPGATLVITGSIATADLGTVSNNGGTLLLQGTLNNEGQTFTNCADAKWQVKDAKIIGGTVQTLPGADLTIASISSLTMQGVTLNGNIVFPNTNLSNLYILGGLAGIGVIDLTTSIGHTIATSASTPTGPLEIGSGILIRNGSATIGSSSQPTLIHGTIEAGAVFTTINLSGSTIVADGTLRLLNKGGSLNSASISFGDGGHFAIDVFGIATRLKVTGNLDLSGEDWLDIFPQRSSTVPFQIVTYSGTLSGTFDHVTPGYLVDYSKPNQILITSVPEPSAAVACVVAALASQARRRKLKGERSQRRHS